MAILDLLGQGILAVVSGGATGLLGVGIQRVFDAWKQKQDLDKLKAGFEHEEKMRGYDIQILDKEWAHRTRVAEVEAAGKEAVADASAFAASFNTEPKLYSQNVKPGKIAGALLIGADLIRAAVRPGLTLYLCWIASRIYDESRAVLALIDANTTHSETMMQVYSQIVFTLLYLFTTCVLWWFGTRNKASQPKVK